MLDFTNVVDTDFSIALTALNPTFSRLNSATALRSYRAEAAGAYSSDSCNCRRFRSRRSGR